MKILLVTGGDYTAFYAEQFGVEKIYKAIENGEDLEELFSEVEDETEKETLQEEAEFEILECDPIDETFLAWITDIFGDDDMRKGTDFFIIGEE